MMDKLRLPPGRSASLCLRRAPRAQPPVLKQRTHFDATESFVVREPCDIVDLPRHWAPGSRMAESEILFKNKLCYSGFLH